MAEFTTSTEEIGPVTVIRLAGYFNDQGGRALRAAAERLLRAGRHRVAVDFRGCTGINSPGVGELLDLAVLVTEDFQGKLVLFGLDEIKRKVFFLAGILEMAPAAADQDEAARLASG